MRVLITGANGFIGRHLTEGLVSRGHSVVGFDRQDGPLAKGTESYFKGDILDKGEVRKAFQGVEVVIHLAALTSHKDITEDRFKTLEINFLGTKNVLDIFSESKSAKKFIYSSTGKVYGDIRTLPLTEEHPTLPLNLLGKSKLITERLIDFYADSEKSFIVFRIFNVFGPGQSDNFLVPTILNQLKQSNKITLGDTEAKRDYVYIKDLIDAFVLAVGKEIGAGLSIFNICSGESMNAKEVVSEISKVKNLPIEVETDPALLRKDEKKIEYGSFEKAKKILGWQPKYSFKEGIEETVKSTT